MEAAQNGKRNYIEFATKLAKSRAEAAAKLDKAVAEELPPLKLDGAIFKTQLISYEENQWGALGTNSVRFEASTNKGIAPGPLERIASGGELSRFLLALKICLEETPYHRTLIFDVKLTRGLEPSPPRLEKDLIDLEQQHKPWSSRIHHKSQPVEINTFK